MKCTFNSALRWATSALLAMTPLWVQAQNAIESINVAQQGASVILKINMKDAPAAPPAGFAVTSPPRIALDFSNTINALGRNSQEIGQGDLRSINVVQVGDRSRMVLNLKGAATFDSKVEGKSVLVTLTGATGSSTGAAPRPRRSPLPAPASCGPTTPSGWTATCAPPASPAAARLRSTGAAWTTPT